MTQTNIAKSMQWVKEHTIYRLLLAIYIRARLTCIYGECQPVHENSINLFVWLTPAARAKFKVQWVRTPRAPLFLSPSG